MNFKCGVSYLQIVTASSGKPKSAANICRRKARREKQNKVNESSINLWFVISLLTPLLAFSQSGGSVWLGTYRQHQNTICVVIEIYLHLSEPSRDDEKMLIETFIMDKFVRCFCCVFAKAPLKRKLDHSGLHSSLCLFILFVIELKFASGAFLFA